MANLTEFTEGLNIILPTLADGEIYAEHDMLVIRGYKQNPAIPFTQEQWDRLQELCFFARDYGNRVEWIRYT